MIGDQASVSLQLARGLARAGEEVWQLLPDSEVHRRRLPEDFEKVHLEWSEGQALFDIIRDAIRLARDEKMEILHSHWLKSFGLSGSVAALLSQATHVVHLHGDDVRLGLRGPVGNLRSRLAASQADLFLFSTPDLYEFYPFSAPATYLPSPIDTNVFRPSPNESLKESMLGGKEHLLLCPARFDFVSKNQDMLARAVAGREFEEVQTVFLSAVDSPERTALTHICRDLGITHRVTLLTGVPYSRMPEYYSAADVVSLGYRPGVYGCAILEAMSCEAPVVSHFDAAKYGKFVPRTPPIAEAASIESITARISELLRDAPLRRRIGSLSRLWVKEVHSLSSVTRALQKEYRRVLAEVGRGGGLS